LAPLVFFASPLCAAENTPATVGPPKPELNEAVHPQFKPANLNLKLGAVEYEIKIGSLPAGKALMEVVRDDEKWPNGAPVWSVRLHVRSNRAVSLYYNVDDTHRSIIDQKSGFSRLYRMELNENNIKVDEKTAFNYDIGEMKARHERTYDGRIRESEIPLNDKTLDPLSAIYYLRSIDFSNLPNNEFYLPIFSERRVWNTRVRVKPVDKPMSIGPWINRSVVLLEPDFEFRGLFERRGPLKIWLDLQTGVPLKVECDTPIGFAEIERIDPPSQQPAK
jgi:hypothetical protein